MTPINKLKRFVTLALFAPTLALVLNSCSVRVAHLTLVSTKTIDLSDIQLDPRKGQRYRGEDCRFNLLGIIPFGLPNLKAAVDKALERGNGNMMVDEVTDYKNIWVVIGVISCIDVEGTVLNVLVGVPPKPEK